jgi:hypothetical protein
MAIISRQIGWGTESNLLYQILKQLNRLTSIMFGLKPNYKVYTALLTQSGGDGMTSIGGGDLTIGVTYQIIDNAGSGWDFTNVGAPNNDIDTYFVATGTTPNSWGIDGQLDYNTGAPVATVLENTIGNIWFTYLAAGEYTIYSSDLFTIGKSWGICPANTGQGGYTNVFGVNTKVDSIDLATSDASDTLMDSLLSDTSVEIRVYN